MLSSLNMTRDHCAVVQFLYLLQNLSRFLTCAEFSSGFLAARRLRSLNSSQSRRLMVLRLAVTHGSSALRSAAVRNGCFLIVLSIAKSSLWLVHLGRPERFRLATPPVSLTSFRVLETVALLHLTLHLGPALLPLPKNCRRNCLTASMPSPAG